MQEEMKLQDYIRVSFVQIWKNKFLIALVTLLFFLVGILYSSWQNVNNTYYAEATIYTVYGATTQEITIATSALSGYSDIIQSKKVCERAEAMIGEAGITADYIRNVIQTSYNKSSTIMTIAAFSDNPMVALKIANAVAQAFVMEIQSITGDNKIQMLDEADEVHLSSNGLKGMVKTIILFAMAGVAISIMIIVGAIIFSNKIKSVEQCLEEDEEDDGKKFRLTAPSNLWTDISIPFWSMAENTPHPTQKPEKLIAKLILASSNEGDVVFDPFLGSGTTSVTAKKLGRHFVGIEREKEYVAIAEKRLEMADDDKTIQGYEDGVFKLRHN